MNNYKDFEFELMIIIVNFGLGSKVLKAAAKNGVRGGVVLLGRGTMRSRLNDFLGLDEIRKEIVVIRAPKESIEDTTAIIVKQFNLKKPNHGIAMIMPLPDILNMANGQDEPKGENKAMYTAVMTIVGKGRGELVMDAAVDAGARGGTIINARGAGRYDTSKLFNIDIEPEREIVMILTETKAADKIASAIRTQLGIDEPGNGVIFCQDVSRVYGIY